MKQFKHGVYILSAEAKDLYNANTLVTPNGIGYNCLTKKGQINTRKFSNVLDNSLELMKLYKVYTQVFRNRRFSQIIEGKEYSRQVINVTFSYTLKTYNKVTKSIYVKQGYQLKDLELEDCVCIRDGELLAIEVNKKVTTPVDDETILGNNFKFDNGKYVQCGALPVLLNKTELREYLYENGFDCNGVHYVRYKRSCGSSRLGKCLFINEALYKKMHQWELCGLTLKEGEQVDLAGFEAYISLPVSSIIDTLTIKPENFLVIDDVISTFRDTVVAVRHSHGLLDAAEETVDVSNSIFDGQSLMDKSLFGVYEDKGMLLLRNRFFKSACFNVNMQQWFADHGITSVEQLNGFTLADDIADIKIITTPSSVKYTKFGTLQTWLEVLDTTFGIVKYEKPTKYCDGRMVQGHYQLLNTLQLSETDITELLKPNLEYLDLIDTEPAVLRHHIKFPYNGAWNDTPSTKNDVVFQMMGINPDFTKTDMYRDFKSDTIRACLRSFRKGHILINGNYSTMLGNGVEMFKASIGQYDGTSTLLPGQVRSTRFEYGETLLGTRSPHINSGNVLLSVNTCVPEYDKYFNLTDEIVCVNAINENIQFRLNGADYDSDTILLTNNSILVSAAQKNYTQFKVPTCFVEATTTKRYYTNVDKADLDVKTSVNKIGEIVNLSQQLNSLLWHRLNAQGQTIEENLPLYYDICKLAVLSGIEIDKAKREYAVNSAKEIDFLKNKYKITEGHRTVKPIFFKTITLENGFKLSKNIRYKFFETSMDYLQRQLQAYTRRRKAQERSTQWLPLHELVNFPVGHKIDGRRYTQVRQIVQLVREAQAAVIRATLEVQNNSNGSAELRTSKQTLHDLKESIQQETIATISNMKLSQDALLLLLKMVVRNHYPEMRWWLFTVVFAIKGGEVFRLLTDSQTPLMRLAKSEDGEISIYGETYTKICKNTPMFSRCDNRDSQQTA